MIGALHTRESCMVADSVGAGMELGLSADMLELTVGCNLEWVTCTGGKLCFELGCVLEWE
jgi:hypothetical protein